MSINPTTLGLLIFAKAPVAGQCKTRLIPRLGAEGAAQLAAKLIDIQVHKFSNLVGVHLELWCSPDPHHPLFEHYPYSRYRQEGVDLGERQFLALQSAQKRYKHALLIGTDVISMTPEIIEQGYSALQQGVDAVIAPSRDGGYGLIGMKVAERLPFQDIPWGSEQVLNATLDRFRQLNWSWEELPQVWDLDLPEQLEELQAYSDYANIISF